MDIYRKYIRKRIFFSLIFIIIAFPLFSQNNIDDTNTKEKPKSDSLETDSLFYKADSVYYSVKEEKIILKNNSEITYHSSNIKADTITIDIKNDQANTIGKSVLKDKDQLVLGSALYFDLNSKWGIIKNGASKFDKGYYYGSEIRKIADKVYDVDNGLFTTCDALKPHFYIYSHKLRLYHNDKVVAKPIIFFVNHFPVFALPFGTFTVKRGRHSGILVPSPGYNSTYGKYIRDISLYFAYKDYADMLLSYDYYEKTGWEARFSTLYLKRYNYKGNFNVRFRKNIKSPQLSSHEWLIKYNHHQDFRDNKTFDANLEFVSSNQIWEGNDDIDERLSEKITSSLAYKLKIGERNLYIKSNYNDDLKNKKKTITLPSISFSIPSKPIYELFTSDDYEIPNSAWWKDFSFSYFFYALHKGDIQAENANFWDVIYKGKSDSNGVYINQHNFGIKQNGSLRYKHAIKNWLNFSQSVTLDEVWFDRDKNGKKYVRGHDFSTMSSLYFSLYGIRTFPNFTLKAIRHIITPKIGYNYKPNQIRNERFYYFGNIGLNSGEKSGRISYSLENRWQLKFKSKEKKEINLNDFFKITSGLSYDLSKEGKKFSNITHNIDLNPGSFQYSLAKIQIRPKGSITQDFYALKINSFDYKKWNWALTNWTFNLFTKFTFSGNASYTEYFPLPKNQFVTNRLFEADSLSNDEENNALTIADVEKMESEQKNWLFSLSQTYKTNKESYKNKEYTSNLTASLNLKMTRNWSINFQSNYNLKTKEQLSNTITITRELHCWRILFKYTRQRDYWSYDIKLYNLKLPDALKFKTRDHKK